MVSPSRARIACHNFLLNLTCLVIFITKKKCKQKVALYALVTNLLKWHYLFSLDSGTYEEENVASVEKTSRSHIFRKAKKTK